MRRRGIESWSRSWLGQLLVTTILSLGGLAAGAGGPVTLSYWHAFGGKIGQAHADLIREFNATHPDVKVDPVYGGNLWTMRDKLLVALGSGAGPDVANIDQYWIPALADGGFAVPLQSLGPELDTRDVMPSLLGTGRYKGKLYAMPFAISDVVMYVNLDLLRKLGLDREAIPSTWNELIDLEGTVQSSPVAKSEKTWTLGMPTTAQTGVVYEYLITLWQEGGEIYAPETGDVAFAGAAGVRALQLWQRLIATGALDLNMSSAAWTSGHLLFKVASSANLIGTYGQLPFRVGVAPLPRATYRATAVGGRSLVVLTKDPAKEEAAATFVSWMSSARVNRQWSLETGYSPLRWSSFASAAYQDALTQDPRLGIGLEELLYARQRPNVASYARVSTILGEAVERAIYGQLDPSATLADAARKAQAVVDQRASSGR